MKKSLLALAVLGAFAGAASAQSNVTLYGRVDLSVGKGAGTEVKSLANGSGSRFGVRGVEDLGGGLQALFNIEHRYNADTGAQSNALRFWQGRSLVGLQGGFGQIVFGREYTTAFLQSQLVADPWGWDTVVAGTLGGSGGNTAVTGGGIATVRNDSSATYKISAAGFTFGAQIAEATDQFTNVPNKPVNFAVSYAAGPITAGFGYEQPGTEVTENAKWMTLNVAYNFGGFKIGGFLGTGNTATDVDRKAYMVTATMPIGAGEFRASYGVLDDDLLGKINKPLALGYHYSMSKRTTIYADLLNDRGDQFTTSKTGYDFGIKHNF
jgi:predicted porin